MPPLPLNDNLTAGALEGNFLLTANNLDDPDADFEEEPSEEGPPGFEEPPPEEQFDFGPLDLPEAEQAGQRCVSAPSL